MKRLGPLVGHNEPFIKDSRNFVELISEEKIDPNDIMVSFDVVSLFTKISLNESIGVIHEVTDTETAKFA